MADVNEHEGTKVEDGQMEIKVEPSVQCYVEEDHENSFPGFEGSNAIPSSADVGALNLWTSKATTCLIGQYKKYRSMVGQSTHIRSLREMFEMISLEMQKHGFYFSPQKCENKWRVLERKYKNLVFRERLKKPGRMRHYGHWEHKRALDEIFNEKKRHVYLEETEFPTPPAASSAKYGFILPKPAGTQEANAQSRPHPHPLPHHQSEDPLAGSATASVSTLRKSEEPLEQKGTLAVLFEKFFEDMRSNFAIAEKNREKRHKEEMAMRQSELELKKRLLKLKEQKIELQKCQIIAGAQHLHLNM